MSSRELIIEGARQNNLKNITLHLPHDKVIAVTGVSGSGKSSLAFDTIFAEGQWRFIESLSTYARLFLEKLDRPDVDAIHNIRPAIALEQKNPVKGSRSTVGTLTEIYDLLRLLYSKISTPFCPRCGKEIRKWDTSEVVKELTERYTGSKAIIIFNSSESLETLKQRGFHRVWVDGEIKDIGDLGLGVGVGEKTKPESLIPKPHSVVLDRLVIKDEPRLSDSIEMAWKEGNEKVTVVILQDAEKIILHFSGENVCDECNISLPEPSPLLFSFNHPIGACPECKGFGNILVYDEELIIPDKYLSLAEGAISIWEKSGYKWWKKQMIAGAKKSGIDIKKPFNELSKEERDKLFKGTTDFYGIDIFFEELEAKRYKLHVRVFLSRHRKAAVCNACNGKRLKKESLAYKISGLDIVEVCELPVSGLIKFFTDADISLFQRDLAKEPLRQISLKLQFLSRVGLDYLSLSRQGKTLSGGEYQRVNLSTQLSSLLTGTLYVLDEPTVGLHPRDTERIAKIMSELSGLGNTIIVVEHDKDIIKTADWVVELGPGGGRNGGQVVFSGAMEKFLKTDTSTAKYIKRTGIGDWGLGISKTKTQPLTPKCFIALTGASGNNLKSVDFKIPAGTLTAVTGVSGSGKSSLVVETFYRALAKHFKVEPDAPLPYKDILGMEHIRNVNLIDQAAIGKSPRSNVLTYLKMFDPIRRLFSEQHEAKAHGYGPGFFSFNVTGGRCETCRGEGYQKMEMYFFEDLYVTCEECGGKRYKPETLRIIYKGKNVNDILNMTVDEALDFFSDTPQVTGRLSLMKDIGLGYLRLGQPATTFSGGESQRIKICNELTGIGDWGLGISKKSSAKPQPLNPKPGILYVLDEPTVGLHFTDVKALLDVLKRLVDAGNTVLVIEHNLDVIKASDWIIDLGPEGGERGGRIIFEGKPEDIIESKISYTGKYLKEYCL